MQRLLEFLQAADPRLCARSPAAPEGERAAACDGPAGFSDALGSRLVALGGNIALGAAFASMMIASLVRTAGVVPGGLGTFEATSVLMLRMFSVPLSIALAATLLFRGLSFWLSMLPGFWYSRRVVSYHQEAGP